jgi:hypothetical protein
MPIAVIGFGIHESQPKGLAPLTAPHTFVVAFSIDCQIELNRIRGKPCHLDGGGASAGPNTPRGPMPLRSRKRSAKISACGTEVSISPGDIALAGDLAGRW